MKMKKSFVPSVVHPDASPQVAADNMDDEFYERARTSLNNKHCTVSSATSDSTLAVLAPGEDCVKDTGDCSLPPFSALVSSLGLGAQEKQLQQNELQEPS